MRNICLNRIAEITIGSESQNLVTNNAPEYITDRDPESYYYRRRYDGSVFTTSIVDVTFTYVFPFSIPSIDSIELTWTTYNSDEVTQSYLDYIQVLQGSWNTVQSRINRRSTSPITTVVNGPFSDVSGIRFRCYGNETSDSDVRVYVWDLKAFTDDGIFRLSDGKKTIETVESDSSPLRIADQNGIVHGIGLCPMNDVWASPMRIWDGKQVKSIATLPQ